MEPPRPAERLDAGEEDHMPSLAPDAGFGELVPPLRVAQRRARTAEGSIGRRWCLFHYGERLDDGCRDRLDGEWTRHARAALVRKGLVVERLLRGSLIVGYG